MGIFDKVQATTTTAPWDDPAITPASIPATSDIEAMLAEDESLGHDFDERGRRFITKLESNSPACIVHGPRYVDGAEPGKFLIAREVYEDLPGVVLCGINHYYVEWPPGRQGGRPIAHHADLPADVEIGRDPSSRKQLFIRENGNVLEDTRYCCVLYDTAPCVLPVTGTGHQFALNWLTHACKLRHPRTGKPLPIFAHRYRLFTAPISGKSFTWYSIKFEDQGLITDADEYRSARELFHEVDKERQQIAEQKELLIGAQGRRDLDPSQTGNV
jgi:hypothetical protein